MDWLRALNAAVDYIESRLDAEIDPAELAACSGWSTYHFHKIFGLMAGISAAEYIRRRRLDRAAFDLRHKGLKVIDIGLKYGYGSPTAFNRAFQKMHGLSPRAARRPEAVLKAYPRISFHISVKGATMMNYRIQEQPAFRILGIKLHTSTRDGENFRQIPKFWNDASRDGTLCRLLNIAREDGETAGRELGLMGLCRARAGTEPLELDYYIAVAVRRAAEPGLTELTVPAATYAVFECLGPIPEAIQDLTRRIYAEWLPGSGYELADNPDIEYYYEGDMTAADYRSEVWLPIRG